MNEHVFQYRTSSDIVLKTEAGVFLPTGTTKLLIEAVRKSVSSPARICDLGCGTGVVGIALHLEGLVKQPMFASDLSDAAVRCAKVNLASYGCAAEVRQGSLFDPWQGEQFEVIVDDISGVAQDIARVSPWFKGVPCDSGRDGTDLVVKVLQQAPKFLAEGGKFFFPVISLSNVDLLLDAAKASFTSVARVSHQDWPLPDELRAHLPLLEELNAEGHIKIEKRFGMVLWHTEVYCATLS